MTARLRLTSAIALALASALGAVHCASVSSTGDETHFICSRDSDCEGLGEEYACVERLCEATSSSNAPRGSGGASHGEDSTGGATGVSYGSSDGSSRLELSAAPGPVANCDAEWPAELARFDSTVGLLTGGSLRVIAAASVAINRNGTAIVAASMDAELGVVGDVVRWANDSVANLGHPDALAFSPRSVSCDGLTIGGNAFANSRPMRWTASSGFEVLAVPESTDPAEVYTVQAVTADGSAFLGYRQTPSLAPVAVRWSADQVEDLFSLPDSGSVLLGWNRNADTMLGHDRSESPFTRMLTGSTQHLGSKRISVGGMSADGTLVWGVSPTEVTPGVGQSFLWSTQGAEPLPDRLLALGVDSQGVVVGTDVTGFVSGDFVWDAKHGVRDVRRILAEYGVQIPEDITIRSTVAISEDHRVLVSTCARADEPDDNHLCRSILPAAAFE